MKGATGAPANATAVLAAQGDRDGPDGGVGFNAFAMDGGTLSAEMLRTLQGGALALDGPRDRAPVNVAPSTAPSVAPEPIASITPAPIDAPSESSSGKWRAPRDGIDTPSHAVVAKSGAPDPRPAKRYTPDELRAMFRSLSLREVMDRLHDADAAAALAAENELLARGLTQAEVEVARRMTSPEVHVRKQLVRELPSMRSVRARTWLFWLSEDDAADVRLAALAELATAVDPATRKRVIEIAERDADRRVIRLAERLSNITK